MYFTAILLANFLHARIGLSILATLYVEGSDTNCIACHHCSAHGCGGIPAAKKSEVWRPTHRSSLSNAYPAYLLAYLYLPTIVSVLYGMAWAWVDLDVKRLEPYFQLSQSDGALAEDSILTSYPQDYLPLIPLKAIKPR